MLDSLEFSATKREPYRYSYLLLLFEVVPSNQLLLRTAYLPCLEFEQSAYIHHARHVCSTRTRGSVLPYIYTWYI